MEHWNKYHELANIKIGVSNLEQKSGQLSSLKDRTNRIKNTSKNIAKEFYYILNDIETLFGYLCEKSNDYFIDYYNITQFKNIIDKLFSFAKSKYDKRQEKSNKVMYIKIKCYKDELHKYLTDVNYLFDKIRYYTFNHINDTEVIDSDICEVANKILLLDIDCNFDDYKKIIGKWIYIVKHLENKKYKNIEKIHKQDKIIFNKYSEFSTQDWLDEFAVLSNEWKKNFESKEYFQSLNNLFDRMCKEKLHSCCLDDMYFLLIDITAVYAENSYEITNGELKNKYIKLSNKFNRYLCDKSNYNIYNKAHDKYENKKYTMNDLIISDYIKILEKNIPNEELNDNKLYKELYSNKEIKKLKELMVEIYNSVKSKTITDKSNLTNSKDKTVSDESHSTKSKNKKVSDESHSTKSKNKKVPDEADFINGNSKTVSKVLKLLLDGDVEFIKYNNRFQFSEQTIYMIKHFINDIQKDKEYKCYFSDLEELIKNKKNGENIQLDYEYNSFEDFFIPYIHQIIASLYEIKIDDNVYIDEQNDNDIKNMHLACTYELLTHSVYNELKEKFLAFKAKLEKQPEDFVIVSDKSMKDIINTIDNSISALEDDKKLYNQMLAGYNITLLNQYKKDLCKINHQEYDEKWYNKK